MITTASQTNAKDTALDSPWPPAWYAREARIPLPRRRADIVAEPIGGEVILTDPRTGEIHRLNPTAVEVWQGCDGRTTTCEIARRFADRCDIDVDDALDCVEETVALLAQLRCVE